MDAAGNIFIVIVILKQINLGQACFHANNSGYVSLFNNCF